MWGSAKGGGHEGVTGAAWHSRGVLSVSRALSPLSQLSPECRADLSAAGACAGKQPPTFNF